MTTSNLFGDELRRLRKEAGLSLADLADAAGFSIVHMSDIERAKKNPPPPEKIQKLLSRMNRADALDQLLLLAAQSRKSIEISVEDKADDVASMLVALARRCDEGDLDPGMAQRIKDILERRPEE